jgi:hypothetical protein
MDFEFDTKPLRLRVAHSAKPRPWPRDFRPFALPDSLYRKAVRRLVAALAEENERLRRDVRRRESRVMAVVATALHRYLREKETR